MNFTNRFVTPTHFPTSEAFRLDLSYSLRLTRHCIRAAAS